MAAYEDDEQLEALKKWWTENGTSVIVGIVLGIGALVGWKGWNSYQTNKAETASSHYNAISTAMTDESSEALLENVTSLQQDYSSTPYAALASLALAKQNSESNDLGVATQQLRWAMENSGQESVKSIARIRLARVLTAQSKHDEALEVLSVPLSPAYTSLVEEVRGDVYRAQGEVDKARKAYNRAILSASGNTDYLRMKRDDLGEPASDSPS